MTFIQKLQVFNNMPLNGINNSSVSFRNNTALYPSGIEPRKDSFSTNPLYGDFGSKSEIEAIIKSNPHLISLLKEYNIPAKPNIEELEKLKCGHLKDSRVTAAKIYSALPDELKKEVNQENLQQAAMLHDYGKVLIPKEILNKNGSLTPKEKEIMDLHPIFGYELLKQKGVKQEVLDLVKYHHQNRNGTGYPAIDNRFDYDVSAEILTAADKYSALTEKRPYHEAMSREEALNIIQQDVESGNMSKEVFDALSKIT